MNLVRFHFMNHCLDGMRVEFVNKNGIIAMQIFFQLFGDFIGYKKRLVIEIDFYHAGKLQIESVAKFYLDIGQLAALKLLAQTLA